MMEKLCMEYDVTRGTYDKIASKWAERHFDFSVMERQYSDFMKYRSPGSLILDVGCGPGRDVKYFMEKGFKVIGIDFSDGMLAEARKRVPEGDFRKMDMRNLNFPDNQFDGIWCCSSFLHIPKSDAKGVLEQFRRILKNCGILYMRTREGKGEEIGEDEAGNKRFFAYYLQEELMSMLGGMDFQLLESYLEEDKKGRIWINVFAKLMK